MTQRTALGSPVWGPKLHDDDDEKFKWTELQLLFELCKIAAIKTIIMSSIIAS